MTSLRSPTRPVTCDQDGFVRGFPVHDGRLDGVVTDDLEREVYLSIRSTEGERRLVLLRDVVAFDIEGFREGNILLSLRVWSAANAAFDPEVRQRLTERLYLDASKLGANTQVLVVESSFGAHIIAVCREVEVSDVGARLAPVRG